MQEQTAAAKIALQRIEDDCTCPYASLEQDARMHWVARILEVGKEPYSFVPTSDDWVQSKGDLVRVVNRAYPGVCYVSEALFNDLHALRSTAKWKSVKPAAGATENYQLGVLYDQTQDATH